jgi:NAD(P)-dependent dehydrogenase (short-subunit alcohol dehydrogenase family)
MKKRSVVISGGMQGIGFEIGKYFLINSNFHLCIIDKELHLENIEFLERHFPMRFSIFEADLSSQTLVISTAAKITEELMPEILINNIGPRNNAFFEDETGEMFSSVLNVVVLGSFLLSRSFLQSAKRQGLNKFRIVNIGSILGDYVGPQAPSYHVAKGALQSLTRYLSVEGKAYVPDLSVILLQIGFIVQNRHREKFDSDSNLNFKKTVQQYQGTSYIYSDEDVATNVFLLATGESASLLNGNTIDLDNGAQYKENLESLFLYQRKNE